MLTSAQGIPPKCGFVLSLVFGSASLVTAQPAGTFTPAGSMTIPRMSHTATLLADGRVLIAGGHIFSDGQWSGTSNAELYDPSAGTFTATGSMTTTRLSHTATLLPDGRVLIAGGLDGASDPLACAAHGAGVPGMCQGTPLATAELFDPATGAFTATGDMSVARDMPAATLLADGKVLIVGGLHGESHPLDTAELYDPGAGTFTPTGGMPAVRAPTATLLHDGRVLIAAWTAPSEVYDPSTGTFTATGHRSTTGLYQTATLLLDGRVLMAGGLGGESDPSSSAELYDPDTGAFTATGDMTTASISIFIPCGGPGCMRQLGRALHTSTLLPDGTVLIAGGWPNEGPGADLDLASAELYDPLAGMFSATGDMATGRCLHTATLLNDGSVLIAGGIRNYLAFSGTAGVPDPLPGVLDSAELYHPAALAPH